MQSKKEKTEKKKNKFIELVKKLCRDVKPIKYHQTGMIRFDSMMGGGIPIGKIIEAYGFPYSGKTTLALEIASTYNKVYLMDTEHATDLRYHKSIGVNIHKIAQPITFEEGVDDFFDEVEKIALSKDGEMYDLFLLDSIGSSISDRELEAKIGNRKVVAALAKAVTRWSRKAEKIFQAFGITALVLNHRKKGIGPFEGEYTPGGVQLEHSAAIRLALNGSKNTIHEDGVTCNIRQTKNKVSQDVPLSTCQYKIERGKGISKGYEIFEMAEEAGLIISKKNWYHIGTSKFNGIRSIVSMLDENEKVRNALHEKIKNL